MGDLAGAAFDFVSPLFSSTAEAAPAIAEGGEALAPAVDPAFAAITGSGEALSGGSTGLAGTFLSGGAPNGIEAAFNSGPSVLSTAEDFLAAPAASGFNPAALAPGISGSVADTALTQAANTGFAGGVSGTGDFGVTPSIASLASPGAIAPPAAASPGVSAPGANLTGSTAGAGPSASVFDTGAAPITGTSATPGGASAASVAAPSGVPTATDPTSSVASGLNGGAPANTTAGAAPTAAGSTSSISDLFSKAGNGALNSITNNPLATALGVAGLGYNIYSGQKQTANQSALSGAAQTAANTNQQAVNAALPIAASNNTTGQGLINSGEALQTYLSSGTLPPQYQQQVDQAINDAKTNAISNAAAQGQPTDPTKNTSLATTLAGIDNQRAAMTSQLANTLFSAGGADISAGAGLTTSSESSLLSAGQSAAGLSGSLYSTLVANDTAQAANTGKAIATLAAALNGKSTASAGGTTITVGGT